MHQYVAHIQLDINCQRAQILFFLFYNRSNTHLSFKWTSRPQETIKERFGDCSVFYINFYARCAHSIPFTKCISLLTCRHGHQDQVQFLQVLAVYHWVHLWTLSYITLFVMVAYSAYVYWFQCQWLNIVGWQYLNWNNIFLCHQVIVILTM